MFARHLLSAILPSHTYGNCSGGLPEKIPGLTPFLNKLVKWESRVLMKSLFKIRLGNSSETFTRATTARKTPPSSLMAASLLKSTWKPYRSTSLKRNLTITKVFFCPMFFSKTFSKILNYPVPMVPNEARWRDPRSLHLDCAPDPTTPDGSTIAISYLMCDVNDVFEVFVLSIISELLTESSNAPFYKSLLEKGLGQTFAPVTGKLISSWCTF